MSQTVSCCWGRYELLYVDSELSAPLKYVADKYESMEFLKHMISHTKDVRAKDNWGWTALHWASMHGSLSCLPKELIARGADVNAQDDILGNTALHRVARLGHIDYVKALIEAGADPTLKNKYGETALHLAIDSGRNDCIAYLKTFS